MLQSRRCQRCVCIIIGRDQAVQQTPRGRIESQRLLLAALTRRRGTPRTTGPWRSSACGPTEGYFTADTTAFVHVVDMHIFIAAVLLLSRCCCCCLLSLLARTYARVVMSGKRWGCVCTCVYVCVSCKQTKYVATPHFARHTVDLHILLLALYGDADMSCHSIRL